MQHKCYTEKSLCNIRKSNVTLACYTGNIMKNISIHELINLYQSKTECLTIKTKKNK